MLDCVRVDCGWVECCRVDYGDEDRSKDDRFDGESSVRDYDKNLRNDGEDERKSIPLQQCWVGIVCGSGYTFPLKWIFKGVPFFVIHL